MWWPTPFPHELAQPSMLNGDKGKIWWPTPSPHELAQPSVLNGDKGKNVVTYSLPPRAGPALCAKWLPGKKCGDLLPSPMNWASPLY